MNERIKELIPRPWTFPYPDREMYSREQMEHLAKLIIKECLGDLKERIALRYQGSEKDRDIAYGMEIVYMDIVDKFGVE
jgi:hypothetical protein